MIAQLYLPRWPWKWIWGLPNPMWISHRAVIARFIRAKELKPIEAAHLVFDDPVPIVSDQPVELPFPPRPFPGGLRFAHVHHMGQVFELDAEQWGEFSKGVVRDLRKRLDSAQSVRFTELLEIADAIDQLG